MSEKIAMHATEAKDANNIKDPHLGWMIGFLFLVSFIGLFALVPLRKVHSDFFIFVIFLISSCMQENLSLIN
jgi:hypothetical protein